MIDSNAVPSDDYWGHVRILGVNFTAIPMVKSLIFNQYVPYLANKVYYFTIYVASRK
jgi:hypothetical protein